MWIHVCTTQEKKVNFEINLETASVFDPITASLVTLPTEIVRNAHKYLCKNIAVKPLITGGSAIGKKLMEQASLKQPLEK